MNIFAINLEYHLGELYKFILIRFFFYVKDENFVLIKIKIYKFVYNLFELKRFHREKVITWIERLKLYKLLNSFIKEYGEFNVTMKLYLN